MVNLVCIESDVTPYWGIMLLYAQFLSTVISTSGWEFSYQNNHSIFEQILIMNKYVWHIVWSSKLLTSVEVFMTAVEQIRKVFGDN